MSHKELAGLIQGWFSEVGRLPVWVRTKSPVWRVLRDNLVALGHWRAKPRGNPKKGYQVRMEKANNE